MKNFRKYLIGFLVGSSLMFAVQAGAATLLGSNVDAVIQVEVDGQSMGQAPVIDGVSYLPVRAFGNKAGYEVAFGEGKATLTSAETPVTPETPVPPQEPNPIPVDVGSYTLETVNKQIGFAEDNIKDLEWDIRVSIARGYEENTKAYEVRLNAKKAELEQLYKIKAALEAQ